MLKKFYGDRGGYNQNSGGGGYRGGRGGYQQHRGGGYNNRGGSGSGFDHSRIGNQNQKVSSVVCMIVQSFYLIAYFGLGLFD